MALKISSPPRPRGARLRRLHRGLALAVALSVGMSTLSGVLHVVMTWTQAPPPPARPAAPLAADAVRVSLADALAAGGVGDATPVGASLRTIDGRPWWQILLAGRETPVYVDAASGLPDPAASGWLTATGVLLSSGSCPAWVNTIRREDCTGASEKSAGPA